jgi:hypothetical protein
MSLQGLSTRVVVATFIAIVLLGASVRVAMVAMADGDRVGAYCTVSSDFWNGDQILC